jgi:hypothetical protein
LAEVLVDDLADAFTGLAAVGLVLLGTRDLELALVTATGAAFGICNMVRHGM